MVKVQPAALTGYKNKAVVSSSRICVAVRIIEKNKIFAWISHAFFSDHAFPEAE